MKEIEYPYNSLSQTLTLENLYLYVYIKDLKEKSNKSLPPIWRNIKSNKAEIPDVDWWIENIVMLLKSKISANFDDTTLSNQEPVLKH